MDSPAPAITSAAQPPDTLGIADTPIQPILASTLLSGLLRRRCHVPEQRNGSGKGGVGRIKTGNSEIDEYVLLGGVERGIVLGISAEVGGGEGPGGGKVISLNLLATTLLSSRRATGTVIDSTGSFSVQLLSRILRHRILEAQGRLRRIRENRKAAGFIGNRAEAQSLTDDDAVVDVDFDVEEVLKQCLERVSISRVFDVWGFWEVIGEIGRDSKEPTEEENIQQKDSIEGEQASIAGSPDSKMESPMKPMKELEIEDSEAEDDGSISSLGSPPPLTDSKPDSEIHAVRKDQQGEKAAEDREEHRSELRTDIVIIDNMTTLISELFARTERTAVHTLLADLSRTIHSLARRQDILIVLLNGMSSSRKSNKTDLDTARGRAANLNSTNHPQYYSSAAKDSPSIFQSATTSRPAFGKIFSSMLDLHLSITKAPKLREDSEMLYRPREDEGDETERQHRDIAAVEWTNILEVFIDEAPDYDSWSLTTKEEGREIIERIGKRKNREQRWCAFDIVDDVEIKNTFESPRKGVEMGQVKLDGGKVAKLYGSGGFGGRRV